MKAMPPLLRVASHRAREKLYRLVGGRTQGYFSWHRQGSWYECPANLVDQAVTIKGISRSKWRDDMRKFIDWSGTDPEFVNCDEGGGK